MFSKTALTRMAKDNLIETAKLFDIDPDPNEDKALIVDAILAAQEDGVEPGPSPSQNEEGTEPSPEETEAPRTVKVLIHEQKDGPKQIKLAVNGRMLVVRPGHEVDLPIEFFDVLKNAVETHFERSEDGRTSHERNVLRFPYSVVGV